MKDMMQELRSDNTQMANMIKNMENKMFDSDQEKANL